MVIKQGDVYWVDLDESAGSEPGYRHPHVVIQNDLFNASQISTVIVCALTSNLRRAQSPGNCQTGALSRFWPVCGWSLSRAAYRVHCHAGGPALTRASISSGVNPALCWAD